MGLGPGFLGCRTFCASKPLPYNLKNMVTHIQAKSLADTDQVLKSG